jgi:hypothetical protein
MDDLIEFIPEDDDEEAGPVSLKQEEEKEVEADEEPEEEGFIERTWGKIKSVFTDASEKLSSVFVPIEETTQNVVVPAHVNEPGRGPPGYILTPRRQKDFAEILRYFVLLRYWEIFESQDMPHEMSDEAYRTWQERVPSEVLNDGIEEDTREVAADFFAPLPHAVIKPGKFKYHPDHPVLLCEHMESNPLAYGVRSQPYTFVRFTREKNLAPFTRFYDVPLQPDEPSPVMFDANGGMPYLYSKGFGLCAVILNNQQERKQQQEEKEPAYHDYVVTNTGFIYPVDDVYSLGQLEPARVAKTPNECTVSSAKSGNVSIVELAYLRGTMDYKSRVSLPLKLMNEPIGLVMDAYGILMQMIYWSHEATLAIRGTEEPLPMQSAKNTQRKALGFIMNEIQNAPWNRTIYYKFLFSEYGNPQSPFPDETYMKVFGEGRGYSVSFLPVLYKQNAREDFMIPLRKVSSKKKRNHKNNKEKDALQGTDKDIRKVSVDDMTEILVDCGIPAEVVEKYIPGRWDKAWNISKIASSHRGETILDGKIAKYARDNQKANGHNSDHAKKELIFVRKKIEQEDFIKHFRGLTLAVWERLHRAASPAATSGGGGGYKEDPSLAEFSAILGEQIFVETDEAKKDKVAQERSTDPFTREEETRKRQRFLHWAETVMPSREGYHPAQAFPRVLTYTYVDDGTVTKENHRVSIQYLLFHQTRVAIGNLVHEDEEEMIIEEEEEEE